MKMLNKVFVAFISTMILFSTVVSAGAVSTYTTTVKSENHWLNYDMCTLTNVYKRESWKNIENDVYVENYVYYVDKSSKVSIKDYCDCNPMLAYMPDVSNTTDGKLQDYCTNGIPNWNVDTGLNYTIDKVGCYYIYLTTTTGTMNYSDEIKFFVMVTDNGNTTEPTKPSITVPATKTTSAVVLDGKALTVALMLITSMATTILNYGT